jgi:hypothetical protein
MTVYLIEIGHVATISLDKRVPYWIDVTAMGA